MTAQADRHAATVAVTARSYTRGVGFAMIASSAVIEEDLAAVIVTPAARSLSNPSQARRTEVGSYNSLPAAFDGWTLVELGVLYAYRRRAT